MVDGNHWSWPAYDSLEVSKRLTLLNQMLQTTCSTIQPIYSLTNDQRGWLAYTKRGLQLPEAEFSKFSWLLLQTTFGVRLQHPGILYLSNKAMSSSAAQVMANWWQAYGLDGWQLLLEALTLWLSRPPFFDQVIDSVDIK